MIGVLWRHIITFAKTAWELLRTDAQHWWQRRAGERLRHVLASGIVAGAALLTLWLWNAVGDNVWSAERVDQVVTYTIRVTWIFVVGLIIWELLRQDENSCRIRNELITMGGVIFLLVTLFVAYATFRNQTRLAAETALNAEGMQMFELEMADPTIRCLYSSYGNDNHDKCRQAIIEDHERWSRAILYVEETWGLLKRAHSDREQWGSTYAEQVEYWAESVQEDPTGMFSYYLASSEPTRAATLQAMQQAGVEISEVRLCGSYRVVRDALAQRQAGPTRVGWCDRI